MDGIPYRSSKEWDCGGASMWLHELRRCQLGGGALSLSPNGGGLRGTSAFAIILSGGRRAMDVEAAVPALSSGGGVALMEA